MDFDLLREGKVKIDAENVVLGIYFLPCPNTIALKNEKECLFKEKTVDVYFNKGAKTN